MKRAKDQNAWTARKWLETHSDLSEYVNASDRYLPVDIIEGAIKAAFDKPVEAMLAVWGHGETMGLLAKGDGISVAMRVPPDTDDSAFITAEFMRLHEARQ